MHGFNFKEVKEVIIDLTHSHIWDVTSVAMLDSAVEKFQKNGIQVTVRGLNEASSIMIDKYGTHAKFKKVLRDLFNHRIIFLLRRFI